MPAYVTFMCFLEGCATLTLPNQIDFSLSRLEVFSRMASMRANRKTRRAPNPVLIELRRAIALKDRRKIVEMLEQCHGARERELTARHLLLHQEQIPTASVADRAALDEFVKFRQWESLRGHDDRMYRILKNAVARYKKTRQTDHRAGCESKA